MDHEAVVVHPNGHIIWKFDRYPDGLWYWDASKNAPKDRANNSAKSSFQCVKIPANQNSSTITSGEKLEKLANQSTTKLYREQNVEDERENVKDDRENESGTSVREREQEREPPAGRWTGTYP